MGKNPSYTRDRKSLTRSIVCISEIARSIPDRSHNQNSRDSLKYQFRDFTRKTDFDPNVDFCPGACEKSWQPF